MSLLEIDVERREDFMRRRGQSVHLKVGPFWFGVNTADGLMVQFSVILARRSFGWVFESALSKEEK